MVAFRLWLSSACARVLSALALSALASSVAQAQRPAAARPAEDSSVSAAGAKVITAHALPAEVRLTLDGWLHEEVWRHITPISDFHMLEPVEGGVPSERTEVRVAYDADFLYIGVMLFDSDPDGMKAFQKRWDQSLATDDRFMWILDTYLDRRNAYFFEINPAGLMGDGILRTGQGSNFNKAWNGIWRAWVQQGPDGWSAEIRIPFRTVNFDPTSGEWGINFQRTIRRRNEELVWSGARRSEGLFRPQNAGTLRGLGERSQGLGLEVLPYTLGRQRVTGGEPGTTAWESRVGGDVNYSITPNLRAGFTINTDFAETDVDDRQVNLTRFPLFFPERRAFFLEGASVFSFAPASGPNPFFSRRIGLADGTPVPILGGARLIGRAGQQDVGFVHLRTRNGESGQAPEDFTVARVSRNILRESSVGLLYTRRATDGDSLPDRHTLGADLELGTSRFAGNRNLQFQAFAVVHTDGRGAALRGASPTTWRDRSVRGMRLNFPNRPWDAHVSFREFGEAYDPAVGFAPRVGFRRVQPTITWRPLVPRSRHIREFTWEYFNEYLTDLDWRPLTVNHRLTPLGVRFESGDAVTSELLWNYERLDAPFDILRDGRFVIPAGAYGNRGYRVQATSASFRRVSGQLTYERSGFWTGTRKDLAADVTVRPLVGVNVTANWVYNTVTLPGGAFDARTYRLLGSIDFTPFVSLNLNAQYDNVSRVLGTQQRLVWILSPGNTIFLVYQHNWRNPVNERLLTLERQANLKVSITRRL
jgi:Domain of unknown function (DUF5916)